MTAMLLSQLKKEFQLNIYEAKIWTALLSRGIASAAELAEISKVPRSRCYDVLESLEKKGYIIQKIGKPIRYIAQKPEVVLERLKKDEEQKMNDQLEMLSTVHQDEVFSELSLLHKSGVKSVDVADISKSIVGRTAINKKMKAMLKEAKQNVIFVTDVQNLEKNLKPLRSVCAALRKKGVAIDVYAPQDKRLAKKLAGINYVPYATETSFLCVDSKEMMFFVNSSGGVVAEFEVALWLDSPFFVQAFTLLFSQSVKTN